MKINKHQIVISISFLQPFLNFQLPNINTLKAQYNERPRDWQNNIVVSFPSVFFYQGSLSGVKNAAHCTALYSSLLNQCFTVSQMLNNLLLNWYIRHFIVIYFPYLFSQENRELHEIIMTLRDERDMKINEVNELKNLLAAVQDQNTEFLQNQVLRLTAQTTKLERNLNAKQGFLETIVTENETLKTELQTLKDEKITRVQDLKKGLGDLARSQPEVRQIMNQVYDNEDGNSEVAN